MTTNLKAMGPSKSSINLNFKAITTMTVMVDSEYFVLMQDSNMEHTQKNR